MQTRLAQSKQKTEVAKLTTELDMTAKSLKDSKQRFGALQVQHRKKELEYEKLQDHLRDLLCEKVRDTGSTYLQRCAFRILSKCDIPARYFKPAYIGPP